MKTYFEPIHSKLVIPGASSALQQHNIVWIQTLVGEHACSYKTFLACPQRERARKMHWIECFELKGEVRSDPLLHNLDYFSPFSLLQYMFAHRHLPCDLQVYVPAQCGAGTLGMALFPGGSSCSLCLLISRLHVTGIREGSAGLHQ
jgi:hypothetical protein